jgi:anti-sigma factor RsiW
MTMHIADNHDALLDYLYEEGDPADRLKIAKHLQECAECSVAVLEFQNVRGMLSGWTPPLADLGFRIVQDDTESPGATENQGARGGRSWRWVPASYQKPWLQVAAAVLLFVSGMAVSQLQVDYGGGALTLRTRSAPTATAPVSMRNASIALPAATMNSTGTNAQVDLDALARELRARLETQNASTVDTERLLQRVRAMIDQSEQRQQRELALRLSQVSREVDTQHQADLLRIQQDVGQQQEALEYLVRTSGGVK